MGSLTKNVAVFPKTLKKNNSGKAAVSQEKGQEVANGNPVR